MANFSPTTFTFGDTAARKSASRAAAQQAQTDSFIASLEQGREDTVAILDQFREAVTKGAAAGMSDDELGQIAKAGLSIATTFALRLEQVRGFAVEAGQDPNMFEGGRPFLEGQMQLFGVAAESGRLSSPEILGRQAGEQETAKVAASPAIETLSSEQATEIGFPEGSIVQRDPEGGLTLTFNPSDDESALQQRIAALVASGVELPHAQGIAAGRFAVSVNPISGERQVIDLNDGSVLGQIARPKPEGEVPSLIPEGIKTSAATGGAGFLRNAANIVTDAIGLGVNAPKSQEATNALESIQVLTTVHMQAAVPGRPNVFLLEMLGKFNVAPNSLLQGEDRAKSRLTQTRRIIDGEIKRMEVDVLPLELQPNVRVETQLNLTELKRLRDAYDELIKGFDDQQDVVDVPKGLSDEDAELFPFMTPEDQEGMRRKFSGKKSSGNTTN